MNSRSVIMAVVAAFFVVGAVAIILADDGSDSSADTVVDYGSVHTDTLKFTFTGEGAEAYDVHWTITNTDTGAVVYTYSGMEFTYKFDVGHNYSIYQISTNSHGSSTPLTYTVYILGSPVVTFDVDGGSAVESITVPYTTGNDPAATAIASMPADPSKAGYTFAGWYVDEKCTSKFDTSATVTDSMTLYAKWIEGEFVSSIPADDTIISELGTDGLNRLVYYISDYDIMDPAKDYTIGKSVFQTLASNDKTLIVNVYDADNSSRILYTWTFDGTVAFNESSIDDLNLRVITQTTPFNTEIGNAAQSAGATKAFYMKFEADGALPFAVYVKVYAGLDNYAAGTNLALYTYNSDEQTLANSSQSMTVDSDGYITVQIDHCSTYAALSFASVQGASLNLSGMELALLAVIVLVMLFLAYAYYRRKKDKDQNL